MRDPYEVLGVGRDASEDDIQRAYRKLAKEHHPDLNPGDEAAEERFKEIATAYGLLSDAEQRRRFDRGEIDAAGQERPERHFYRGFAEGPGGAKYRTVHEEASAEDLEAMFAELFGGLGGRAGARPGGFAGGGQRVRLRGQDVTYSLEVDFLEAANGASRTVSLPDGGSLRLAIPAGVRDGQMLRLKGKGGPGFGGGPPGDAYVEVHIRRHPFFERKDDDVHLELPVTLGEAVLGGKVEVPTVEGKVTMTIPKGSSTGRTLRLKGRGIPDQKSGRRGDQYVRLKVVLPERIDEELERLVGEWAPRHPYDPRRELSREGGR
jgi:DnaJ-class molecular chaperone